MSMSIQGGNPPKSLDTLISEVGIVSATDESADARAAQLQAREHRLAANTQRKMIEAQRKALKEEQEKAKKPGLFKKALGLIGRACAAIATNGYSLIVEGAHLAKSKGGGSIFDRLFASTENKWFAWFTMVMTPVPGIAGTIADVKQQSDRTQTLLRDQAELETTSTELDKLRRAMTRNVELAKDANERAAEANEEVQKMADALDAVSRSAARSIEG